MNKMNMRKIRDMNKQLKDENNSIEMGYKSVICCNCSIPATHKLVTGLGCYPNFLSRKSTLQYVFGLDPKTKRI